MSNFDFCKECGSPAKCLRLKKCQLAMTNDNEPARNQCDGCARGLPVRGTLHYDPVTDHVVMACTAHLYNDPAPQDDYESHHPRELDAGSPDALGECKKIHAEPELLSYWKTLPAPSNERLAVEIIETLQGELAQSSSCILSLEYRLKKAEQESAPAAATTGEDELVERLKAAIKNAIKETNHRTTLDLLHAADEAATRISALQRWASSLKDCWNAETRLAESAEALAKATQEDAEMLRWLISKAYRKMPGGFGACGREPYYWHLPILPESMTVRDAIRAARGAKP